MLLRGWSRWRVLEGKREYGGKAGSSNVVCFNCGEMGHISTVCKNPPLSYAKQKRVRDESRAERDAKMGSSTGSAVDNSRGATTTTEKCPGKSQPGVPVRVATASTGVGFGGRITEVTSDEKKSQVSGNNVAFVRVVAVAADKRIVGQACATLMRMPAVAAIFENAMVDKRVRVEDDDYELPGRSAKQPRTQGPTTRSGTTPGHSTRSQAPPQVLMDTTPEPDTDSEEDVPIILLQRGLGEGAGVPVSRESQEARTLGSEQPVAQPTSTGKGKRSVKAGTPVPPINWMRGQKQYSLQDVLNDVTPKISFPQLLDVSPLLRRELVELLRSSVPRTRKKTKGGSSGQEMDASAATLAKKTPLALTEAHGDEEVTCLYIDAWIEKELIGDILIDGGAMLDLISGEIVDQLKLERHIVRGLGIRLADDSLVHLDHNVWADVIVSGVIARIKAYVVPVSVIYKVLLSRRWLKWVKGIEYHETNILYIEGKDGVRRKVKGKPAAKQEVEIVRMAPADVGITEAESEEDEDAIETLLHELDHWEEVDEREEPVGNC